MSSPSDAALPLDLRMFGIRMCVMCFKWAQSKPDKNIFEGIKTFYCLILRGAISFQASLVCLFGTD